MYILADAGLSDLDLTVSQAVGLLVLVTVFLLIFARGELMEAVNELGDSFFARKGDGPGFDPEPEEEPQWAAF